MDLHRFCHSQALRTSAEPVSWSIQAPASLAPPPLKRLASRCARNERREVKSSTLSATKGWQRIGRSNTMRQRAQSPACSSKQAYLVTQFPIQLVAGTVFLGFKPRAAGHGAP